MRTPSLDWTDSGGDLVLGAVATVRAARLITEDEILAPARERVLEWALPRQPDPEDPRPVYGQGGHPRIAYLITCPWCVSVWAAAALAAGLTVAPRATRAAAAVLAWSAAAGYLSERE